MWSEKQRIIFLKASNAAGWNEAQRYTAMRACGCPLVKGTTGRGQATETGVSRPSVKAPGNTNEMFGAVMMLAESCARGRGAYDANFPRPGGDAEDWIEASYNTAQRLQHKAREIWAEAKAKMPGRFFEPPVSAETAALSDTDSIALDAFARRVTQSDSADFPDLFGASPANLDECDAAQCVRVVEGLKAWVGREFYRAGSTPRTFYIPSSAIAQVNAEARRHVSRRQTSPQETSP